jgi:hypothetical protein
MYGLLELLWVLPAALPVEKGGEQSLFGIWSDRLLEEGGKQGLFGIWSDGLLAAITLGGPSESLQYAAETGRTRKSKDERGFQSQRTDQRHGV